MALECFVKSSESQIVDIRAGHDLCCPHKHILKICKTFTLSFGESFLIYLLVSGSPLLLHYSIVVVHGHHPALVPLLNVHLGWMVSLCEALSCSWFKRQSRASKKLYSYRDDKHLLTNSKFILLLYLNWKFWTGQHWAGQQQKH